MRPRRAFRSMRSEAMQKAAMTSEATVISKPSWRGMPLPTPPKPSTMLLNWRSFISTQRFQTMRRGSILRAFPCLMWLSSIAAHRLFAAPIAWKSPVKWRLMSSIGTTWAYPPPAAPPLIPKTGPSDGSRRHRSAFLPRWHRASSRPTDVVVLPSPAGVGLMAVTRMSFAFLGRSLSAWMSTFAL